ncbi:MAG TPA: prephenate dehydratase domain-containing protein [Anaerovoracaceae bacterium]|nr:prephenate dehydratase domain-containing protein [Anaerovoracaceae bacterium]
MDIQDLRKEIDNIDAGLIELFEKRMETAKQIGEYKIDKGMPVYDPAREREKLSKIADDAPEGMRSYLRMLYASIFEMSKEHQRRLSKSNVDLVASIQDAIENTPRLFPENATVACQGTEGAYSQLACDKIFKESRIMYTGSFEGVFSAVSSGLCQYGILPLENSTAGSVNQIYDLMMKYNFYIVRCVRLKIDHNLMANPGTKKEAIKEIFSHEQALLQCGDFLNTMPGVKVTVCENTAVASQMVAESGRKDVAAISSFSCAELYGLACLERSVQDKGNNYTKFICISKKMEIFPASNKTSLMLVVDHKPGALYKVLARFYVLGINLVKLESRPIPDRDFEFMFYFDIESQVYAGEFIRMMSELEDISQEFRYLGSYLEIV